MGRIYSRLAVTLVAVVALSACGGDGPTAPRTTATSLAFTTQPADALGGVAIAGPVRVTALDANGKPATIPIEITIDATSPRGAAALGGTRTVSTRGGVAAFPDLTVVDPGRGVTLTAKATGLNAITSNAFDVRVHFRQVTAGHTSACGLDYGNVTWCWGDNTLSRLGVGGEVSRSVPTRLLGDFRFDTITSGGIQQCGRLASRDVLCWGGRHPTPTPVAGRKFIWVASGSGSCGVATDGALLCWNGPEGAAVITPTLISNGPFKVSATYWFSCGIDTAQRPYCRGDNDKGQLGFPDPVYTTTFTKPVGNLRLTSISPGLSHGCGLQSDGIAWCWGDNQYGQLGSASAGALSSSPVQVDGGHRFASISVGVAHTCALSTDGGAWCWGGGAQGQLGNGSFGRTSVPVQVVAPVKFAGVDAGGYFGCGLGVDGFTYCWGNNNNGELADGTTTNRGSAVRMVAPES